MNDGSPVSADAADAAGPAAPADPPGVGPLAGERARADRREDGRDRRAHDGPLPEAVPEDRRTADRRGLPKRSAGLEISPAGLSLAVCVRDGGGGAAAAGPGWDPPEPTGFERFEGATACRFRPWPAGCGPTEPGFNEDVLAEAFAALVTALGPAAGGSLNGVPVEIALGGAICVTRVLSGANEKADREAADLARRAARYIALGRGEKTCVTAVQPLDAARKRVRVTVAPTKVAAAALAVCTDAGLRCGRIEHTIAGLSAALHARGADGDRPVLLLAAGGGELDIAVAHRGRLLLDYRPAAPGAVPAPAGAVRDDFATGAVLLKHLKRIRRYVATELRGEPGAAEFDPPEFDDEAAADGAAPIGVSRTRVYLTGPAAACDRLAADLTDRRDLRLARFPVPPRAEFAAAPAAGAVGKAAGDDPFAGGAVPPGPLAAALLACGTAAEDPADGPAARGDLSLAVRPTGGVPWLRLARVGWPVAAAAVLSAGLWAAAGAAGAGLDGLRKDAATAESGRSFAGKIRDALAAADELDRRGGALAAAPPRVGWVAALGRVGAVVATADRPVWLEEVTVTDAAGTGPAGVEVVAGTHGADVPLDVAAALRRVPGFAEVTMAGSRPARFRDVPGFRFTLTATLDAGPGAAGEPRPAVARRPGRARR